MERPIIRIFTFIFYILLVPCLFSCTSSKNKTTPSIPRIDPGYVQWLERHSMLAESDNITNQISGTEKVWHNNSTDRRLEIMLEAAPNWLEINPHSINSSQTFLREYSSNNTLDIISNLGFSGLYIAPLQETSEIWNNNFSKKATTNDIISQQLNPKFGSKADFTSFCEKLDNYNLQLGGSLIPIATGIGPDFFLQARKATKYDGIYALIQIPKNQWQILPEIKHEWIGEILPQETVTALSNQGIIPNKFVRDGLNWASKSGWASTGIIRGTDGVERRYIYRYNINPEHPLLLWQDPSGHSKKILSASIIQHTGLQQQSLASINIEPLMGLDTQSSNTNDLQLAPATEALLAINQEIHRYGGWSLLADKLPLNIVHFLINNSTDFLHNYNIFEKAIFAIKEENPQGLHDLLKNMINLKIDFTRLAHGINTLQTEKIIEALNFNDPDLIKKNTNENILLQQACLTLLSWRIGLPGLTFIDMNDITGKINDTNHIFGNIQEQLSNEESIVFKLNNLLQLRKNHKLAQGKVIQVTISKQCIAIITKLPSNNYWVLASNFSKKDQDINISIPNHGNKNINLKKYQSIHFITS